jgi:transcription initiation factor TFIID subunit TAF12
MTSRTSTVTNAISADRIRTIVADTFNDEIDEATSGMISELMDDMLESIVDWSVKVAESRGTNTLDVEDVRFICEHEWGLSLKDNSALTNSVSK